MNDQTLIHQIENLLVDIISDQPDIFLVGLKIKPTHNFKIYVDGDNGLPIDRCIKINRALYKKIEELGIFPEGDFSLEVSSPGVDEPLKNIRQYKKNIGRKVEIVQLDETINIGILKEVLETELAIESSTGKGKKLEIKTLNILLNQIKTITVQVIF